MRFDKEVLLKSTVSTSISLEIDELHNSPQESSLTAGEAEMKEVRDSDEPDEIQESSSETDEDEIKEMKNSETSISSERTSR